MERKKILIAEDDLFISRAYCDALHRAGFEVIAASDGEETMEKIMREIPDLILLDLVMPLKSGFEVAGILRSTKEFRNIPIIITSNLGQDADIQKGKELGVADYLVKSNHSVKEVIEKIRYHLEHPAGAL